MIRVLMVPGFTGSGPHHWQSYWQRAHPHYARVEQADWDRPEPNAWVSALNAAIAGPDGPVVLAGHSLGCIPIVRWAERFETLRVVGALLVAPSDVEAPTAPLEVRGFAPFPLRRLPFASHVVASTDDPLVTIVRARVFAASWGSEFTAIERAGHLDTDSGHGPWPAGHGLLEALLASSGEEPS